MSTKPPATTVRPTVPDKGPPPEPVDVTHVDGREVAGAILVIREAALRIVLIVVATILLSAGVATWVIGAGIAEMNDYLREIHEHQQEEPK